MNIDPNVLDWLLEGDPAIRWQVMRDLLGQPEAVWRSEQDRLVESGWGAEYLRHQLPDGSWPKGRCTDTIWILLLEAAEARALEFMLAHRLYKSDKTGAVIHESMTQFTFPAYWHYTVLRGLDYMCTTPQVGDPRLEDAVNLIESRRKPNGRWPVEKCTPGNTFSTWRSPAAIADGTRCAPYGC